MEIHRPNIMKHNSADKNQGVDSRQYIPKKYKDLASGMEKQFAKYMVEQMTKDVQMTDKNSPSGDYYQDILVEEYTKKLSDSGNGLGIKDIILDDIYPKKFRNPSNLKAYNDTTRANNNKFRKNSNIELAGPKEPTNEITIKNTDTIKMGDQK